MKKFTLLSLVCLAMAFTNCSKDDSTTVADDNGGQSVDDTAINAQEETVLNANTVSDGLIIEGAEKIQGNPLTPNGAISFNLGYDQQSAFLKNGFDIAFTTTDNYAGAYIQIKSEDNTVASTYYDVPAFSGKALKNLSESKKNGLSRKAHKMEETQDEIDVFFEDSIPPGKFCYIICIYDAEGNISLPQEVCVEIEAWGGNSSISGTWNYTKSDFFLNGDLESSEAVGVEDCGDDYYYCNITQESQTFENSNCYTTNSLILVLNANGTFRYDENYNEKGLDYEANNANTTDCNPIFKDIVNGSYYGKGNWAYNETNGELTLVEFEYGENGEVEFDEEGDVFGGTAKVSGNTMTFEYFESSTFNNEETTYRDITYFVR